MTISPVRDMPVAASRCARNSASCAGSCSGEVTIKYPVEASRSSEATPRVRSLKPSITPDSERKKRDSSPSSSTPVTRAKIAKASPVVAPKTRAARPPGARNTFSARPSRKPSRRVGVSRKSTALRDGGVSSTITSKSASWRSSYSFAIALSSCEPATAEDSSR